MRLIPLFAFLGATPNLVLAVLLVVVVLFCLLAHEFLVSRNGLWRVDGLVNGVHHEHHVNHEATAEEVSDEPEVLEVPLVGELCNLCRRCVGVLHAPAVRPGANRLRRRRRRSGLLPG
uniref:Uncharacterized protein n=1 Tax=Rhipicephalus zambeziensis TaxID=60191 RepID=A0A224YJY2_9ACAR